MRKRNNAIVGFTLIELAVVAAMVVVVSLAMYAVFNNGIKIWQKINCPMQQEDLGIFFDRFTHDLRNSFKFSGIVFSGEAERLQFATLVNSPDMHKITVGGVVYYYDRGTRILSRQQMDYSQLYDNKEVPAQQALRNIKSLKFKYYSYDGGKKEYLWEDEWAKEGMPLAVRVEIETNYGRDDNIFTKTVSIPVSG